MVLGRAIVIAVCLACWVQAINSQGTDGSCMFGDLPSPMIVQDLPDVCSDIRGSPQCCARDFILRRLNITEEEFIEALRAELQDRFNRFRGIAERVREFLDSDFLSGLFLSFADLSFVASSQDIIEEFADELEDHFDIDRIRDAADNFNVTGLLRRLINRVIDEAVRQYASLFSSETQQCIRDVIQDQVDEVRMEAFAAALEQVRLVRTSLDKLADFLDNLDTTLLGYRPLRECVNRLVEVADCDSCLIPRPPLCRNWCGALARACYSPFYQILNNQFDRFWMIVREILDQVPTIWRALNENRRILRLTAANTVSGITDCINPFTGKRQAGPDSDVNERPALPSFPSIGDDLGGGAFQYDRLLGPRFCRFGLIRTAARNCWDGTEERDNDIDAFDVDSIDGQGDNPAIQIDTSLLQSQANALGSPVDTFVESEAFTGTAPDGLSGGSPRFTLALSLLVAGLLAALCLNIN